MASDVFSSRDQEDELLRYAFVPKEVEKYYAIRFKGYIQDLPHYFLKHVNRDYRDVRTYCPTIVVNIGDVGIVTCKRGDWIVGNPDGDIEVMRDEDFLDKYKRLLHMLDAE